jgi:quercetin dioxygenase-like cupin family protein
MKSINRSFKNYGRIDVSNIKKIIIENNLDWDEFDFRQKRFNGNNVHKETKTIPIIFDEHLDVDKAEKTKHYHLFESELDKIQNHIREVVNEPNGWIYRALLIKLPKGKEIAPHVDKGVIFEPRRMHIPIETNEKCLFSVGETTKNLKEGEIWEINNDKEMHGVSNHGDTDRVHLLIDWKN